METSKRKKSEYLFLTFMLFIIIFDIPLIGVSMIHVAFLITTIIFLLRKDLQNLPLTLVVGFINIFVLCGLLMLNTIRNLDFETLYMTGLKILEIFMIVYVLLNMYKDILLEDVVNILIIVASIQAVITVLTIFLPSLKTNILLFVYNGDISQIEQMIDQRFYGFGLYYLATMPIFQSMIGVLCIKRYYEKNFCFLPLSFLLLLSAAVNSRTSIIVYMVGFLVVILLSPLCSEWEKVFLKSIFLVCFSIIFLGIGIALLNDFAPETLAWINDGYMDITNHIRGQDTGNGFFDYINGTEKNFELTNCQILFGVGQLLMGNPYKGYKVDIGYINYLYLGGIFLCLFLAFTYGYFIHKVFKLSKSSKIYAIVLFATFLIMVYKGPLLNANEITTTLLIIYVICEKENMKVNVEETINYSSRIQCGKLSKRMY